MVVAYFNIQSSYFLKVSDGVAGPGVRLNRGAVRSRMAGRSDAVRSNCRGLRTCVYGGCLRGSKTVACET